MATTNNELNIIGSILVYHYLRRKSTTTFLKEREGKK
jgi:hypothetical protein